MDEDRKWFVEKNAVSIVEHLEKKIALQKKELARLNRRLEHYNIMKQAIQALKLQNEALLLKEKNHETGYS